MMKIYLDSEFKCHVDNSDFVISIETDFFDNKCKEFIEGYRYIPSSENWTRDDGAVFYGEMISPWKDYNELDAAQREYERSQITQLNISYQDGINSI